MSYALREKTVTASYPSIRLTLFAACASATLLALFYARFGDVDPVIKPFLQRAADGTLYSLDFGISNSIIPRSSPIFSMLSSLGLDLSQPVITMGAHLICCLLAGIAVWKVVTRVFGIADPVLRPLMMIAMAFADRKFFPFHKGDWISCYDFSFSATAVAIRFWFVYFALTGRYSAMCLTLIPINILTFKVGWLPTLVAGAMMVGARVSSKAAWASLALAIAPAVYIQIFQPVSIAPEDVRTVFDEINARFALEDNPFRAPFMGAALFLLGCGAIWLGALKAPVPSAKLFMRCTVLISLAAFFGGGFYLTLGHKLIAIPALVWLSPMRALELASFLIYLCLAAKILTAESLSDLEKALLFFAIVLYRTTGEGLTHISIIVFALIAAAALLYAARRFSPKLARILAMPTVKLSLLAVLLLPALTVQGIRTAGGLNRLMLHPTLGFVERDAPIGILAAIRQRPDDARLIFLRHDGREFVTEQNWNFAARKSSLDGNTYYLVRASDIEQQHQLDDFVTKITDALDGGQPIGVELREQARALRAHVVLPAGHEEQFPGWMRKTETGGWVELAP
jgi:hypothetical protein